jgi:type I restriction enzyme, S subunit
MEVKPGCKQTEVGVIPEVWDVLPVSSLGETKRGASSLCIRYKSSGGVRLIRINDFFQDKPVFVEPTDEIMRYSIHERDLLFAGTGASAGASYFPKKEWIGLPHSYNAPRIRVSENHCKQYLLYSLQSDYVLKQQKACFVGNAQPFLDTKAISNFSIAVPRTLIEQEAIAAALSDADALIESLEQLIAKKRHLKQGAMQELVTGEKRLPGFNGEWEVKPLEEILKIRHGKSQRGVVTPNGKYPILASGGEIGRTNMSLYEKPSVLIGRKGTIDNPQFISSPFWTVDTLFFTECVDDVSAKFIFYKFCMINWRSYNEASGVPSLNARTIENIEINIPKCPEQTAIAAILSDMDAEIATLEIRLGKTRQLKKGMMQELLTGRIRLI